MKTNNLLSSCWNIADLRYMSTVKRSREKENQDGWGSEITNQHLKGRQDGRASQVPRNPWILPAKVGPLPLYHTRRGSLFASSNTDPRNHLIALSLMLHSGLGTFSFMVQGDCWWLPITWHRPASIGVFLELLRGQQGPEGTENKELALFSTKPVYFTGTCSSLHTSGRRLSTSVRAHCTKWCSMFGWTFINLYFLKSLVPLE